MCFFTPAPPAWFRTSVAFPLTQYSTPTLCGAKWSTHLHMPREFCSNAKPINCANGKLTACTAQPPGRPSVADPRGFQGHRPPLLGSNSFIFMQFLVKVCKIICWRSPVETWRPHPRGKNPETATVS